jgi:glycosyltransferase involved in cell wall biosynthesis
MPFFARTLKFKKNYNEDIPLISIVVPIYNQQEIIDKNLGMLVKNMSCKFEFIIIDDHSSDLSCLKVLDFFKNIESNLLTSVKVYSFKIQKFETYCDNFGVKMSQGKYVMLFQPDMQIMEEKFDTKFLKAYNSLPNIFMLSGRGVHKHPSNIKTFNFVDYVKHYYHKFIGRKYIDKLLNGVTIPYNIAKVIPTKSHFYSSGEAGRLDLNFEQELMNDFSYAYLGETIMRGPLFFEKTKFQRLGGFDTKAFFLGDDDHDLCIRARMNSEYVGFVPINVISSRKDSTNLKNRSVFTRIIYLLYLIWKWRYFKKSKLYSYNFEEEFLPRLLIN